MQVCRRKAIGSHFGITSTSFQNLKFWIMRKEAFSKFLAFENFLLYGIKFSAGP